MKCLFLQQEKFLVKEDGLMKPRLLGILSLICLAGSIMWLVLMIAGLAGAGPLDTFEQVLAYVSNLDTLFYLSYLNAAFLVTIPAVLLMTGLYVYCKPVSREWMVLGAVFIPIYGAMNLFAYLSQVTVVPALIGLRQAAEYQAACDLLLRLMIQQWPGSAVAFFNSLAYAILGIPSIIFGIALAKHPRPQKWGGILLAINGAACIMGVAGSLVGNSLLRSGVMLGGVLFILALIPLSWTFLRMK
jgi:hypothetical protein